MTVLFRVHRWRIKRLCVPGTPTLWVCDECGIHSRHTDANPAGEYRVPSPEGKGFIWVTQRPPGCINGNQGPL